MSVSFIYSIKRVLDLLIGPVNAYFYIKNDLEALRSYAEVSCLLGLDMIGSLIEKKHLNCCLI